MVKKTLSIILVVFITTISFSKYTYGFKQKRVVVVFRYDDYSSKSPIELEKKIFITFAKLRFPLTIGVVPNICAENEYDPSHQNVLPLTLYKINIIKKYMENGLVEVAMHGFAHQAFRENKVGKYSEFYGRKYNDQIRIISEGKDKLEKIFNLKIRTFIPPWNSYDKNTLKILEKVGFSTISADKWQMPNKLSKLNFLPETCTLREIPEAIRLARKSKDNIPIITIFFHPYSFLEIDNKRGEIEYKEFERILNWISLQKDICLYTIDNVTKVYGNTNSERFLIYSSLYNSTLSLLSPNILKNLLYIKSTYPSQKLLIKIRIITQIYLSIIYFVALIASILVTEILAFWLYSKNMYIKSIANRVIILACMAVSIYNIYNNRISFKVVFITTVLYGSFIGSKIANYRIKKKEMLNNH